ncbi:hypothetical protein SADUNF_Sadunf11G0091500 [Salix dunnii]|uniref:Uncharacterized protein n=1 Tax=Salix dunnii TaxID=1413687 RepID=A0A835MPD7_9ROSI|nr:hypothetical protein SADUNF_Sadunf11G0091500 [Salix dunnii]
MQRSTLEGVEALFEHWIVRAYRHNGETPGSLLIISEGTLLIYVYSILVILETIISCIFFKSCKATTYRIDQQGCRGVYIFLMMHPVLMHQVYSNEIKSRTLEKVHRKKI